MATIYDMHCHVGFCPDAPAAAAALQKAEVAAFSCSVTPEEYQSSRATLEACDNVRVALGLHPWWVQPSHVKTPADAVQNSAIEQFLELASSERYIGEVGMDLSPRHAAWQEQQQAVFRRVVRSCALKGGKVLSIHAVRASSIILDELNEAGLFRLESESTCIFHWFSGTPSELKYAKEAGCYFSINPRMLESKRGRFYAQNIPLEQLLLETDAPEEQGQQIDATDIRQRLEGLLDCIAELRKIDRSELAEIVATNSKALLGL